MRLEKVSESAEKQMKASLVRYVPFPGSKLKRSPLVSFPLSKLSRHTLVTIYILLSGDRGPLKRDGRGLRPQKL